MNDIVAASDFNVPLSELELSERTGRGLATVGVTDLQSLIEKTGQELLEIPDFGRKGLNEVVEVLQYAGLELRRPATDQLHRKLAEIRAEWLRRRHRRKLSPMERPSGYLKRQLYGLAKELRSEFSDEKAAVALVEAVLSRKMRGRAANSITSALISAVATDDQLKRVEKNRYADELEYALRHGVPDEYLVGFLLQVGSDTISKHSGKKALSRRRAC